MPSRTSWESANFSRPRRDAFSNVAKLRTVPSPALAPGKLSASNHATQLASRYCSLVALHQLILEDTLGLFTARRRQVSPLLNLLSDNLYLSFVFFTACRQRRPPRWKGRHNTADKTVVQLTMTFLHGACVCRRLGSRLARRTWWANGPCSWVDAMLHPQLQPALAAQ